MSVFKITKFPSRIFIFVIKYSYFFYLRVRNSITRLTLIYIQCFSIVFHLPCDRLFIVVLPNSIHFELKWHLCAQLNPTLSFNSRIINDFFLFCKTSEPSEKLRVKLSPIYLFGTRDVLNFDPNSEQEKVKDYPWVSTQVHSAIGHINITLYSWLPSGSSSTQ